MQNVIVPKKDYEKLRVEGRLIILDAALDSTCYFLTPDCSKCNHSIFKDGSKKCMYNLKTEKCYICDSIIDFDDAKSLGEPDYWQVNDTILTIHYNKLFRGKFGRSIFTDKERAMEMADKFNTLSKNEVIIGNSDNILSYDNYIKLEMQNRIVILPCKIGEKYYVAEPDCLECKYKNNGYKGCGYVSKKRESPYTCNYNNENGRCYVFNQSNGNTFYINPVDYEIKEIYLMSESQYDFDRKSFCGVWLNRDELEGMLYKIKNKSCV